MTENTNPVEGSSEEELSKAVDEALADVVVEKDPVASLTEDLQRLTAEYANYRKRVDRDRITDREASFALVMSELLPILDNIERCDQSEFQILRQARQQQDASGLPSLP